MNANSKLERRKLTPLRNGEWPTRLI